MLAVFAGCCSDYTNLVNTVNGDSSVKVLNNVHIKNKFLGLFVFNIFCCRVLTFVLF